MIVVPTGRGDGRLHVDRATDRARAGRTGEPPILLLGHGAGGGVDAADLSALAGSLPVRRISVIRFEQPWRVAGQRVAAPPPRLDEAWRTAVAVVREEVGPGPLIVGGRSAGARVACRTADELDATAVVCLAFPLHPPGRPEKSRLPELTTPSVPVLVLQGSRDPFGHGDDVRAAVGDRPGIRVVTVPGADHGLRVTKTNALGQAGVRTLIITAVAGFCLEPGQGGPGSAG